MVGNLFPFKGNFSFRESQESQDTKYGLQWGWVTWVIWRFTKKLCMKRDAWAGVWLWWSHQSPVAHSCGLLNYPNSFHRGMFKLKAKLDADLLLYSLSHDAVNASATQYTCSLNGIYFPHRQVQWSCHCSHMCIPVHSPWLPGYITVVKTILVILTKSLLPPYRPHILKNWWHFCKPIINYQKKKQRKLSHLLLQQNIRYLGM